MSDFSPGDKVSKGNTISSGDEATTSHQFTGSVWILGTLSASSHVSASAFIGNGAQLTNLPGGGGGAPTDASYLTLGTNGTLSAERVATAGLGITLTDGGAGSTLILSSRADGVTALGTGCDDSVYVSASLTASCDTLILDNKKIYFGSDTDAYIEYDESGSNELVISGAVGGIDILVPTTDAGAMQIKDNDNTYLTVVTTAGQQTVQVNYGLTVTDNLKVNFGSGQPPSSIEYDANGSKRLVISGSAAGVIITGSIIANDINSGSIAGAGSYVGINSRNELVLTASAGGGGGSPGGSDTELQYNNGGSFGGVSS